MGAYPRPMNFAERLLSSQVAVVRRKPQVGDVVVSPSDVVYEVTQVLTDANGRADLYEVRSLEHGLPNTFEPREIGVLSAPEQRAARTYYEQTRSL